MAELDRTVWTAPVRNVVWVAARSGIDSAMDDRAPPRSRDATSSSTCAAHDCRALRRPGAGGHRAGVAHLRPRRARTATSVPTRCSAPPPRAARCPQGSTVTVEPGGQVELATPPGSTRGGSALDALRIDGADVRRRLGGRGHRRRSRPVSIRSGRPARTLTPARATTPWRPTSTSWGPAGRRMMSSCASIQVNIDSGDADDAGPPLGPRPPHRPGAGRRLRLLAGAAAPLRSAWPRGTRWTPPAPSPAWRPVDSPTDWATYVLGARLMLAARRRRQLRSRSPCR